MNAGRAEVEAGLESMLTRLWRFALTQCGDQSIADDLVQATCQRALEKADQFRAGTRLDSWLYAILVSIWRNMARSIKVRQGQGLVEIADTQLESADADEETKLHLAQVLAEIAKLPDGQSSVMLLVCVEGMTYAEASVALRVPIGTIMSRLHAARRNLQLRFDKAEPATKGSETCSA